jgi:hypothetical protein
MKTCIKTRGVRRRRVDIKRQKPTFIKQIGPEFGKDTRLAVISNHQNLHLSSYTDLITARAAICWNPNPECMPNGCPDISPPARKRSEGWVRKQ